MANTRITVDFVARHRKFERDVARVEAKMGRLENRFKSSRQSANKFGSTMKKVGGMLAVAFSARAVVNGMKNTLDSLEAMGQASIKLGESTEALSQFGYAAEQSGLDFNVASMALQRMARRVGEAAVGTGEAKAAIKELGLDAKKLGEMAPVQQLMHFADALDKVGNSNARLRLAMKLFDSEGVKMLQVIDGGADALRRLMKEGDGAGRTMSQDMVRGATDANKAIRRFTSVMQGASMVAAAEFAPVIEAVANFMADNFPKALSFTTRILHGMRAAFVKTAAYMVKFLEVANRVASVLPGFLGGNTFAANADALAESYRILSEMASDYMEIAIHGEKVHLDVASAVKKAGDAYKDLGDEGEAAADKVAKLTAQQKGLIANLKEVAGIWTATRTPVEQYEATMQRLGELMRAGIMDADLYARAQAQAAATLEAALPPVVEATVEAFDKMSEEAEKFAETLEEVLGDSILNAMRGQYDTILEMWIDLIDQMVAKAIAADLVSKLMAHNNGSGSFLDKAINFGTQFLGKNANGGDYRVGGSGGTDSQLVSMLASPGETVHVRRQGEGFGGTTIVMNIQTPDADSFRRSQGQILSRMQGALASAGRLA